MSADTLARRRAAGRPPKIRNTVRKWLYVDSTQWDAAEARARADDPENRDAFPDALRALVADYAAGRITPSTTEA